MKKTISTQLILLFGIIGLTFSSACKKETVSASSKVTSHTFNVTSWGWDSPNYYTDLGVAEITADNLNSVAVMVYYSVSQGVWISVPNTVYGTLHDYHMGFLTSAGRVEVTWFYDGTSSGSDPNAYYSTNVQCKVVVIPESERKANPDIDLTNYEQVKARFKLAD